MVFIPLLVVAQSTLVNGDRVQVGTYNSCEDAGSTDSYACSLSPAILLYVSGSHYFFRANTANTGAATLALNGLAAKTIKKMVGGVTTDLADNDIRPGQRVLVVYDGTNDQMQMLSQLGNCPIASSETVVGCVELATPAETTTGTDNTRAVSPDGLAGSVFGEKYVTMECVADGTALTTGDGKCYFPVHANLATWQVVGVSGHVGAAVSSSGVVTVDIDVCGAVATGIRCSGTNRDLLSTNMTIDANEDGTETAAGAVINTANDDLASGEWLRVNIDAAGTGTQGLYVTIILRKP